VGLGLLRDRGEMNKLREQPRRYQLDEH
jgi:hypothetical protein